MHVCIWKRNEPYLHLPSQSHSQLVLCYRPWRDGRLSWPWCEVAPAEIRTRNLQIAHYHYLLRRYCELISISEVLLG